MSKDYDRFRLEGFPWGKGYIPRTFKNDINYGPSFFHTNVSVLAPSYWQAGVGGELDLKYIGFTEEISGQERSWRPQVNHGWYYFHSQGHYMYSDGGTIDYFPSSGIDTVNSGTWMRFSHIPKLGIPILARQYERVSDTTLNVYREFGKVPYFKGNYSGGEEADTWDEDARTITWGNVDRDVNEMMVIYNMEPTNSGEVTVSGVLNRDDYIFDVGSDPISSGTWDTLYYLGMSDGTANQAFNLPYIPVEQGSCHIFVYDSGVVPVPSSGEEYEIVDGWHAMGSGEKDCILDYDLGVCYFGDGVSSGVIPSGNYSVGTYYKCTVGVEYEKQNTADVTTAWETALELLKKGEHRNFLLLAEGSADPITITLEADLPTMSPTYGPLKVGNSYSLLTAQVLDANDTPVENQDVEFFFNGNSVGYLGTRGNYSSTGSTNGGGNAYTRMLSPSTIFDVGELITASGVLDSGTLRLENYHPSSSYLSDVFTYVVTADDEVLGYYNADSGVREYLYPSGVWTLDDPDGSTLPLNSGENYAVEFSKPQAEAPYSSDIDQAIEWENDRRDLWEGLGRVTQFAPEEHLGRKTIVSTWSDTAINPHTGTQGAFVPLLPSSVTSSGSYTDITYSEGLPDIDPMVVTSGVITSGIQGYFVAGPMLVEVQARTYNQRRNTWIYSNSIDVYVGVGEEGKGTYYFDAANALPSGVLSSGVVVDPTVSSGIVPFGWRLRSTSPMFTAAAALDRLTFLDIN